MIAATITPAGRRPSAFSVAAWISLLAPPVLSGIMVGLFVLSGQASVFSRQLGGDWNGVAVLVDAVCFGLGVFSLFGIRKHGAAFILWKAVPGVLLSGGLGFCHYMLMMLSGIRC
jgi:hypothetical protein